MNYPQPAVTDIAANDCNIASEVKLPVRKNCTVKCSFMKTSWTQERPISLLYDSSTSGALIVERALDLKSKHLISRIYVNYMVMGKSHNISKLQFPHL